jgi:ribose/xylose/arabinose/galactoside ABC-type transport system permease subunit
MHRFRRIERVGRDGRSRAFGRWIAGRWYRHGSSNVIAAVVIGGASLMGGRGTAMNTIIGVLVLGIISNFMNLQNVLGYHQNVVKGVIILLAVLLQTGFRIRPAGSSQQQS